MAGPFTTPVAQSVPLENKDAKDNDFKSLNVQDGLEEIDFRRETKEPTGFLNQDEVVSSFVNGTRTFTITPISANFTYYIRGCAFVKTSAENIVIPNTNGIHYIYYDNVGTGNLVTTQVRKNYDDEFILVRTIYWNVSQAAIQFNGDSRSILGENWGVQRRIRNTQGAIHEFGPTAFKFQNFVENGDGTLDAHAQLGITGGKLYSEDVEFTIVHSTTPSNPFEQDIDSIAQIPILYREGSGAGVWRKIPANDFPMADDTGNLIQWNEDTGGTWQLTNASENTFVATYLFATTDPDEPIIGVLGDVDAGSPLQAIKQSLLTPIGLPYPQFSFLGVAIFQTSSDFTNTPKARLAAISNGLFADSVDRYAILASYNGNANNGRVLEVVPGEDSEDQPVLVPEDSFIRTVTLQSTSTIANGKSIGFFILPNTTTPILTVVAPTGGQQEHQFDVAQFISKGSRLMIAVVSGSIQTPAVRFWLETVP